MRIIFAPISIAISLVAAMLGKAVFGRVWGVIEEEEPPDPKQRDVPWSRLLFAGAIEGVIFRLVRIASDRGVRRVVYNVTGRWPGDKRPERR